ncbi:flagellar hook-length control protein FliK [Nocardia asteroides]|uniref:flagellar hook-length control protein FliK n=1 Tax=Nocardia asteroides TaxID=1824 RepID=UPI001E3AED78|nr:flagellar hook-length control protein FliK [Nocardia asteroides]UGT54645.1 flagellar hook-length control protein FliK [Nocardia asteroides]
MTTTVVDGAPTRVVRAAEWIGYAFLVAGWIAVTVGLWSPPSPDPAFELGTSDQVSVVFYVYGPLFFVLAPGLLGVGVLVVRNRVESWALVIAGLTLSLYTQLVATLTFLTDHRPQLSGYLGVSLACTAVACLAALAAVLVRRWPGRDRLWTSVAALLVTAAAVGPLITSHGERQGPIGWVSEHPECGLTLADWVDADGTAVYTGTLEYSYRPDTKVKPAPVGPVEVTVTLADGRMTTTMSPDNPVAMAETAELLRNSRKLVTSVRRAEDDVHVRMESPDCDRGTRVATVTFSGAAAKDDAEERPVELHHVDGQLTRVFAPPS